MMDDNEPHTIFHEFLRQYHGVEAPRLLFKKSRVISDTAKRHFFVFDARFLFWPSDDVLFYYFNRSELQFYSC